MVKIDKRKKYFLLLDVETVLKDSKLNIYDLGFAIVDRKGLILAEKSLLIEEIWGDSQLMKSAYYSEKIPRYLEMIKQGKAEIVPWRIAVQEMRSLVDIYKPTTVGAYNLEFDKRAMRQTHEKFGDKKKVLSYPMKELCLWGLACETIFSQKTFPKVATREGWVSNKGNYKTSAEIAYRYITGDYNFKEEHTGLEDVKIEAAIMADCFRQRKKISGGIVSQPWRIPNNKRKK